MSLFRTGLLLATLMLSACSMPILDQYLKPQTEDKVASTSAESTKNIETLKTESFKDIETQYNTQKALAESNYTELKKRVGTADVPPKTTISADQSTKEIESTMQRIRSYTSKTNTDIASLDSRVADRQKMAVKGDLIRIFLSEATVTHDDSTYKAQPLVGEWVRGETRVIRLKDNILFESPRSEDLLITFSETYQLIVNEEVIATVNPNKEKNSANFSVNTQNNSGSIIGTLDYRISSKK